MVLNMYWPAINSIILLCLTIIIILMFSQLVRKFVNEQKKVATLDTKIKALKDELITYEHVTNRQQQQITELSQRLATCLSPLEQFEIRLEEVTSSVQLLQSNLDSESTEQKLYGRAKKMIEMGATIEELILECEVPRAEAELLLSIYKS